MWPLHSDTRNLFIDSANLLEIETATKKELPTGNALTQRELMMEETVCVDGIEEKKSAVYVVSWFLCNGSREKVLLESCELGIWG